MPFNLKTKNLLFLTFSVLILASIPVTVLTVVNSEKSSRDLKAATVWAFEETFDGTPTVPQPFKSNRWDVVIDSNDIDGIMDGQTVPEAAGYATDGAIELGHGPHCEPPYDPTNLNNPNNIHTVPVDFDVLGFQQNTRPLLNFICNNHMMSVAKAGYGISSFMPRQIFDWNGRTGTIEFETSLYPAEGGREWWDLYIAPPQEILLDHVRKDEGGDYEQMPKRALKFKFGAQTAQVSLIDNYLEDDVFGSGRFQTAFPSDPALTDPRIRRIVRVEVSNTNWKFEIQKQDGTYWTHTGTWPQPLSFNQGLIRWGHHSYNATKDGNFGRPWSQFTFHWDNMRFDGPVIPAHTAFEPTAPHFVDARWDPDPNRFTTPVRINVNVPVSDIRNPKLVGHINSFLATENGDLTNSQGFEQFRVNGGTWQNVKYIKDIPISRTWTSFRNSLTNVVSGENTIEFRYPLRPTGVTWQFNGFTAKDLEIQIDPVGVTLPPGDTTPPTVSIAAPSNGSTVSGSSVAISANASDNVGVSQVEFLVDGSIKSSDSTAPFSYTWDSTSVVNGSHSIQVKAYDAASNQSTASVSVSVSNSTTTPASGTINFNDRTAGTLSGTYPTNVASWGSGWIVSGPFAGFTTNNISFSGATITQASFTFASARRVVSLEASNGGGASTTISISCTGNTTKTQTLAAGATATITTGWTANCTNVTVSSTNSWDTNFDNIVFDTAGGTSPPPPPPPPPTTTPKPGDVNGDGQVNSLDLSLVIGRWGTADTQADLNQSGRVDSGDLAIVIANWGR